MANAVSFEDILRRWEAARRLGQSPRPEDLCRDYPHLLEPLRRAIAAADDLVPGTISPDSSLPSTQDPQDPPGPPAPPDTPLAAGAEPVPGYRLVRLLGTGGFGEVWQAEAPGGFAVAVKFVHLAGRLGAAELRSLPVLRRVRHPHVLNTFGSWQVGGRLVIAMELADRTLGDRLKEAVAAGQVGIPADELLGYMRGVAKGLDYLNEPRSPAPGEPPQSIRHRDVKPQNLLLLGDHVKVADFGLARVLDQSVARNSGGFTPAYAAPEFFAGESAPQSDQYSLAVAYCELRGGRLPFRGTIGEVMIGHVQEAPDLDMLPPAERPVVARALAKKPADRWPNCGAFVEAVARATPDVGDEQAGTKSAPVELVRPRPRRWPAAVVGLTAGGVVVGVLLYFGQRPPTVASASKPPDSVATGKPPDEVFGPLPQPSIPDVPTPNVPSVPDSKSPPPRPSEPRVAVREPGERLRFAKHEKAVRGVVWVNDELVVSCGGAGEVWVWNARTGEDPWRLVGHAGTVHAVAVAASGRRALSAGEDKTVRLWDLDKGELSHTLRKKKAAADDDEFEVYGVAFDGDDRAVSAGNADLIVRWDLKAGAESGRTRTGLGEVLAFARSPDGKRLLLGGKGGRVVVHEAGDGGEVAYTGHADDVLAAAWFPDGKRFVTAGGGQEKGEGGKDYTVRVWTVGKDTCVSFQGHADRVTGVSVSPDGKRILSGDDQGRLRLWDVDREKELPRFDAGVKDPSPVTAVAFSPDGTEAVSGHADGTARVWRVPK